MSLQLKANQDLYELIEALSGTGDFTSQEKTWLLNAANRRMYEAYRREDYWPRYLVSYEPRSIENQILPLSEDSYYVFGAGTDGVDGLYTLHPNLENTCPAYTLYDAEAVSATDTASGTVYEIQSVGTTDFTAIGAGANTVGTVFTATGAGTGTGKVKTADYSLIRNSGDSAWIIIAGFPNATETALYSNSASGQTVAADSLSANAVIDETGWTIGTGDANAPQVRDLSDIGTIMRIHRNRPFYNTATIEYDFNVQADGVHVYNLVSTTDTKVWATYKKRLTLLSEWDEDGTNGTTEVPIEFFYWLAHATYADFLRLDGQVDKARMEESIAKQYLYDELEDTGVVMNRNTVGQRIRTHVSTQSR